jgi:dTDP-4-amino-4,6-dideoxygalactose transaminase
LSLMALGIGVGDEVIVPSFTFFATASAVWRVGATIVFADIDPATFNLAAEAVEAAITPATRAVIPVHLFGQCADMDAICRIARTHGLHVIEDGAQAIGAQRHGLAAGSWGDVGCFSFYPTKNLGGFGDGGMLTTNDDDLAGRLRLFASHGMKNRYYHEVVGINSRLDSIQAAVLNVKIKHLSQWIRQRQANAVRYEDLLAGVQGAGAIRLPACDVANLHVWNQYTIRVAHNRRDSLFADLNRHGIGTAIYYPVPLHLQECFATLGYAEGSLPHTEQAAKEVISLPIFPELTDGEQQVVARRITSLLGHPQVGAA